MDTKYFIDADSIDIVPTYFLELTFLDWRIKHKATSTTGSSLAWCT